MVTVFKQAICSAKQLIYAVSAILPSFILSNTAFAERSPVDFNGDGISEIVVIKVVNPVLRWQPVDTSNGTLLPVGLIGVPGDHVIMSDWLGTGTPQMGIARLDRSTKEIVWRVKDVSGAAFEKRLGKGGDIVGGGADLDGNGRADAVLIQRKKGHLIWTVAYDALAGGQRVAKYTFGAPADSITFLNPDGQGERLLALSRKAKATDIKLLWTETGKKTVYRGLPALPRRRKNFSIAGIQTPTGAEVLGVVQSSDSKTWLSIIDFSTKKTRRKISTTVLPTGGIAAAGNYLSNPGGEIAIQSGETVLIVNPFDGTQRAIGVPEGVLVDEINFNRIGKGAQAPSTPEPDPEPEEPVPSATPGTKPSGGLASVCSSVSSIGAGELLVKSEASSHIHGGDPRTTGYTVVCSRLCPRNLSYAQIFYADGSLATAVAMYGRFSGNGQPRLYGAVGRAPQHFANEIARRAASIGNGQLYLQMSGATSGSGTSCKSFSPSGRNGSI